MGNNNTQLTMQRRQHDHEYKLAVLDWLKANDENIYILGVAAGMGVSQLAQMLNISQADAEGIKERADTTIGFDLDLKKGPLLWYTETIHSAAMAVQSKLKNGENVSKEDMYSVSLENVSNMGTSFYHFCFGMLVLKNIGPTLQGIGEMIPG